MTTLIVPMTTMSPLRKTRENVPEPKLLAIVLELQRSGDESALRALIERTQKACLSLAYAQLKDRDLAQDAVQEAYLVVYRKIGQLREPAAFKGWLYKIVSRACNEIRRKRKGEFETDLDTREDLHQETSPSDQPENVLYRNSLKETFADLPDIDRETLALREVCSLSYDEMSRVLAVPIGTVKSRLAKARKRFINLYNKEHKA